MRWWWQQFLGKSLDLQCQSRTMTHISRKTRSCSQHALLLYPVKLMLWISNFLLHLPEINPLSKVKFHRPIILISKNNSWLYKISYQLVINLFFFGAKKHKLCILLEKRYTSICQIVVWCSFWVRNNKKYSSSYTETAQLICRASQQDGFYTTC